jgi:cell division transport system permease protein
MSAPRKEKTIGSARETRRYDLPLNKGAGTRFLAILIGLMAFLAVLALAASFTLSGMSARWTSGLENRVTVEIPAQTPDGATMDRDKIKIMTAKIDGVLHDQPAVADTHIMGDDEIAALVQPWLGDDGTLLDKIPLPGLITVELRQSSPEILETLDQQIKNADGAARLDSHEEWLDGVLHFTGALQFAALALVIAVGLTMLAAVAGAVHARMEVNRAEVELLHLMGATDDYIARQFQRHSLILAFQGGLAGLAAGAAALGLLRLISGHSDTGVIPALELSPLQMAALIAVPVVSALIAAATARRTVLRALRTMP